MFSPPGHKPRSFPLGSFLKASGLHVGAAAAAASLREDLVDGGTLTSAEFDEAYAIARITPGTNLLAMYTLLGQRLAGWRGALTALSTGALIPAAIAGVVAAVYVNYSGQPIAARAMQGSRAGALAVFAWAGVRLLRPQIEKHRTRGVILAIAALVVALSWTVSPIALLLAGGLAGATLLRQSS
jgi:chromate transporter